MCLSHVQGLRSLQLRSGGSRSSLRCAEAGQGTHGSAGRYGHLNVLRATGHYAIGKVRNLDTFRDVVVTGWDNLMIVSRLMKSS